MVVHNEESIVHIYIRKSIMLTGPCRESFPAVCKRLSQVNTFIFGTLEIGCLVNDNSPAHHSFGAEVSVQEQYQCGSTISLHSRCCPCSLLLVLKSEILLEGTTQFQFSKRFLKSRIQWHFCRFQEEAYINVSSCWKKCSFKAMHDEPYYGDG